MSVIIILSIAKNTVFILLIRIIFENIIFIFQDREFVEVDLPLVGALKKVGGPVASSAPSPTPSDTANQSIFNNCCGKSNCCRKVICMISLNYCQVNRIHDKSYHEQDLKNIGVFYSINWLFYMIKCNYPWFTCP